MAYTTINKGSDYFNTKLFTGNGSTQSLTGVGFQPDFTWIKGRTNTPSHMLADAVRGATKIIFSNLTNAEDTDVNSITSFDADGFSIGSSGNVNGSGQNYVGWNWKAGTTASGSTSGSGTAKTFSSSTSTTSGFSIVKYVGNATANHQFPHGLGVKPDMVFIKNLTDGTTNWQGYHTDLTATKSFKLNSTDVPATTASVTNNVEPTTTVFNLGSAGDANGNDQNHIAYLFASIKGYSKIGTYVGNGNADGTFVYTGFKPSFIIMKNTADGGAAWQMFDNKRDIDNVANHRLFPNASSVESTDANNNINILSNGFKMKTSNGDNNASGSTFIYMTFAEAPIVGTNNVPANAR